MISTRCNRPRILQLGCTARLDQKLKRVKRAKTLKHRQPSFSRSEALTDSLLLDFQSQILPISAASSIVNLLQNYLDVDFDTEEEYDEHARALEEQWIDSLDNASTASLSQSSSNNSPILQGIVLGFFFPLLPFFFIREPKPTAFWENGAEHELTGSVVFSKRMQMGIVVGLLVNLLFGTWRYLLDAA